MDTIDETNKREAEIKQAMADATVTANAARQVFGEARNALAELGLEPNPIDFATPEAWQAARTPWAFAHAHALKAFQEAEAAKDVANEEERQTLERLRADLEAVERDRNLMAADEITKAVTAHTSVFVGLLRDHHEAIMKLPGNDRSAFQLFNIPESLIKRVNMAPVYDWLQIDLTMMAPLAR